MRLAPEQADSVASVIEAKARSMALNRVKARFHVPADLNGQDVGVAERLLDAELQDDVRAVLGRVADRLRGRAEETS